MSDSVRNETTWGRVYAERSQESSETDAIAVPRVHEARDTIYGGTMPFADGQPAPPPSVETRNRRASRRKFSPFNMILALLAMAIISVLYISNVLTVGRLLQQINDLEQAHQRLLNDQEMLRAQVNRLSSLERVEKIAQEQLGLRTPGQAPVWLPADEERIRELEQALQERRQR
jgi:cell division protein FtsL